MTAAAIAATFAIGIAAGLLSGLIGIGGGVLMVPFLYFFYDRPELFGVGVAPELRVVVAHATSLLVIVPTAIRGSLAFHRVGLVEWRAVWPIGLSSILAAALTARMAPMVPPELLKIGFGAFLTVSAVRLAMKPRLPDRTQTHGGLRLDWRVTVPTGILVGVFSALLGVGGGIVAIPLLMHLVGVDVRRLAATSMGIITITASAGAITYMITGAGRPGLPPGSIGYVHLAAAAAMFMGAFLSVRWGALLNQRMRPRALTLMFAAFFLVVGVRLVITNLGELRSSPVVQDGTSVVANSTAVDPGRWIT
jgi:uncharacterized protein